MPSRASGRSPALVIALEGVSGAGKTTVAAALAERLGGRVIPEAYERLGRTPSLAYDSPEALGHLEHALLSEEAARFAEAEHRRANGASVVLDTSYLGPLTYSWGLREVDGATPDLVASLVRKARELLDHNALGLPDLTLYLDVPEELATTRAGEASRDHPAELRERHRQVGRYERILYEREFPRTLPGRFAVIAGEGRPGEIASAVADRLERFGAIPPAWRGEAERLLTLFEPAEVVVPPAEEPTPPAPKKRRPSTVKK